MFRPLAHRDFAFLWTGQSVSLVGDGVFTVTLALQVLALTPRPTALATVLAARALPRVIFLVIAGAVSDRLPRRRTALVADVVRGVAVGGVALLSAAGVLEVWHLAAMAALFGMADAFFLPTMTAMVPEILPQELLVSGSALSVSSRLFAESLAGPALGGVLVGALGTDSAFGIDAASFAVSAACLLAMRARPAPAPTGSSILTDAREGLRYTRSQPWLWASLLGAGVGNFAAFSPLGVLLPLLIRGRLHGSASAFGLVIAAVGVGGLAAAIVAGRVGAPRGRVTVMWSFWMMGSVALIATAFAPTIVSAGMGLAAMGFALEYGNVLRSPLIQELVPQRLLGRVSAVDWLVSLALTPLGISVAGPVASAIGAQATMGDRRRDRPVLRIRAARARCA
jgi:MFS family permease